MSAIVLKEHEFKWDGDNDWEVGQDPILLSYIIQCNAEALEVYRAHHPSIAYLPSKTAEVSYWMNTCVHCGQLQGDWYLREPEAVFFPVSTDEALKLKLTWFETSIDVDAQGAQSTWIDELVAGAIN